MSTPHPADDRLIDFTLAELEAAERHEIETHLRDCGTCRKTVGSLSMVIDSARSAGASEPPARVLVDLLQAQAGARVRSGRLGRSGRLATAVAAVVLLGVIFAAGFAAGRRATTAPAPVRSGADTLPVLRTPLPEPPEIPFHTAQAFDAGSS